MKQNNKPVVTYAIMVVCIAVFAGIHLLGWQNSSEAAIFLGAYYKPMILCGEWWRLLTVGFTHIEAMHLFVNLYALNIMGKMMESALGHVRFAVLFFGSVLGGSLFLMALNINQVVVGCSAGLYGLMACYVYMIIVSGGLKIPSVRNSLITTLLINFMINMMPGVSVAGHMGGGVTGILLMLLLQKGMSRTVKINTSLAAAVLAASLGWLIFNNAYIYQENRYPGTDLHILNEYRNYGLVTHADNLVEKLDDLYCMNGDLVRKYKEG